MNFSRRNFLKTLACAAVAAMIPLGQEKPKVQSFDGWIFVYDSRAPRFKLSLNGVAQRESVDYDYDPFEDKVVLKQVFPFIEDEGGETPAPLRPNPQHIDAPFELMTGYHHQDGEWSRVLVRRGDA